jgi:peptidoglycan/LPS O-acetylase OafA/YrhL
VNSQYTTPIPSLDGIRAVAVIMVVLSHIGFGDVIPGGLGVTIFFFLSGYLITTLLCKENEIHARINVRAFYLRRFLRLFPPLAVCLLIAYSLLALGWLDGETSASGFFAQVFYFANYYLIFFEAHIPNGTGILWSLAVEEHYYIFFPIIISPLFRRLRHPQIGMFLLMLCCVALLWRIHLVSQLDFRPDRTYLASDTRFDSILYGSVLALMKNPTLRSSHQTSVMLPRHWISFLLGSSGVIATLLFRDQFFRETFRYTLQGIALMPIFYCAIRFSDSRLFNFLNSKPFKRIGVLSYSIYLIHLILVHLVQQNINASISPVLLFLVVFTTSIAYATIIERFIDRPLFFIRSKIH